MAFKKAKKITTVEQLVAELLKFRGEAKVVGTWESITRPIRVYQDVHGLVLIDADDSNYQEEFQTRGAPGVG